MVNQTENELGRCGPLANVYKSVVVAGCNRIVNPLVSLFLWYPETVFKSITLSSIEFNFN